MKTLLILTAILMTTSAYAADRWAGNFTILIERGTYAPCSMGIDARDSRVAFDGWARQRASVAMICFEVYRAGVTDQSNFNPLDLDVKFRHRFKEISGEGFSYVWPYFVRRNGNNAIYAVNLRQFDVFSKYTVNPDLADPAADSLERVTLQYYVDVQGKGFGNNGQTFEIPFSRY